MRRLETALRQSVLAHRLATANVNPGLVDSVSRSRLELESERLTEHGRGTDASRRANMMFGAAVAFLLYMSMFIYGQAVLRGVLEEKTTRVAEVVMSSVSPETLLAGKVIGVGAVGLVQQIIWIGGTLYLGTFLAPMLMRMSAAARATGSAAAAPSMSMPDVHVGSLLLILAFFVLGYGLYASMHAAVGAMVNSDQEAQQALAPVMLLIVSSAIFIQPVMMNPASTTARVVSMFPFTAPIIMPLRMGLVPVPAGELAVSVIGLVVAFIAVIYVAARIYRVGLLMYGKRPSVGELVRWVRQS